MIGGMSNAFAPAAHALRQGALLVDAWPVLILNFPPPDLTGQ
jgi:hypothetical protein